MLDRQVQEDFSVGVERDVAPHLISPRGLFGAINGLMNDDGSVYRRGGSVAYSKDDYGHGKGLWDGWLQPGRRTLIASATGFAVLAADGTPIDLGGGGFATVPRVMRELEGMLFIGAPVAGGTGTIYGGSRKAADYEAGTIKTTNGSRTVEGAGTAWEANIDPGMLLRTGAGERVYVVSSVDSNTVLTIRDPYEGVTGEGKAYTLKRLEDTTEPYKSCAFYAIAARRLVVCDGQDVWLSNPGKPHIWKETIQPSGTVVDTKHTIPEGVQLLGQEAIGRERVHIFTTQGVWTISNLSHAIVDGLGNPQHRLDQVSRELVLLGNAGITGWRDALIVPCVDDVFVFDGVSEPEPVSRSIRPLYRAYVRHGYTVGQAHVHLDHLFLPIVDSTGEPQDLLVCRLDRPTTIRGQRTWPWSFLRGAGARVAGVEARAPVGAADPPKLLGSAADGMVLDLARYFLPDADVKNDHDGITHPFEVVTRDWSNADLAIVRWRRLRGRYEMEAAPGDEPLLYADIGSGLRKEKLPNWDEVKWDEFKWASDEEIEFIQMQGGGAVPNAGAAAMRAQNAKEWFASDWLRYARFRLRTTDPVAKLTIRGIEVFSAIPGGVRHSEVT